MYSADALSLRRPDVFELPRSGDRISFLYLDMARIRQDRTGVVAENDSGESLEIPVGSLSVLLLGPGVSLTSSAAASLFRQGASVLFTADEGAVGVSSGRPLSSRAKWAEAQARLWTNDIARLAAARTMYRLRYPAVAWPDDAPLNAMRGLEGRLVRNTYRDMCRKYRISGWRREYNGAEPPDRINSLLNLGNSILYGSSLAACSALALSPALGIIHEGSSSALLFDLADPHKVRSSIPLAFELRDHSDSASVLRRRMRDYLHKERVLESHLKTLDTLLSPFLSAADSDRLIDDSGAVPGHSNHDR